MKKWYRKTELTQFEQFDGSEEMVDKYSMSMKVYDTFTVYHMPTLEGWINLYKGDWIATGVDGEHWAVKDDVFKKTYKKVSKGCDYCRNLHCLIGTFSNETGLNAWVSRAHKLMIVGKLKCKNCGEEEYVKRDTIINYCPICGRRLTNE